MNIFCNSGEIVVDLTPRMCYYVIAYFPQTNKNMHYRGNREERKMIGRKSEKEELLRRYRRNKAEFVAVYGRRRVGKTTLITETFQDHFTFRHAGLTPAESEQDEKRRDYTQSEVRRQLKHFYHALIRFGLHDGAEPSSWLDAFYLLEELLKQKDNGSRQNIHPWCQRKSESIDQ